jgi:hypothetical protein
VFDVHFLTQAPEEWTVSGITPGPNTFSYFSQKGLSSALRECDFKSGLATLMTDDKLREVQDMLTVTKRAAVLLKAAKNAEGAANNAGIRILRNAQTAESEKPTVGLAVADAPYPDDKEFEQQGASHSCGGCAHRAA